MTITRRVLSASALAVLASSSPAPASSPTRTVTKVVAVVNPKSWNAPCPAALTFTGTIFVSRHPATVTYRWERSDGVRGQVQTLTINASGEGVTDTWTLGAGKEHKRVWEKLHVLTPTGISSNAASIQVNCR
jgi:hypothetical protein